MHDYFSDEDLWAYLASLDLSVLPYTFGTHSGWLEACRDLQTTVLAPSCGYYAEQGPVLSYTNDGDALRRRPRCTRPSSVRMPSDRSSVRRSTSGSSSGARSPGCTRTSTGR